VNNLTKGKLSFSFLRYTTHAMLLAKDFQVYAMTFVRQVTVYK